MHKKQIWERSVVAERWWWVTWISFLTLLWISEVWGMQEQTKILSNPNILQHTLEFVFTLGYHVLFYHWALQWQVSVQV
jgi:hypothetical protein